MIVGLTIMKFDDAAPLVVPPRDMQSQLHNWLSTMIAGLPIEKYDHAAPWASQLDFWEYDFLKVSSPLENICFLYNECETIEKYDDAAPWASQLDFWENVFFRSAPL